MKKNKTIVKKVLLSKKGIDGFLKKLANANKMTTGQIHYPAVPTDTSDNWIMIGGSSKPINKLMEISSWQTGQTS